MLNVTANNKPDTFSVENHHIFHIFAEYPWESTQQTLTCSHNAGLVLAHLLQCLLNITASNHDSTIFMLRSGTGISANTICPTFCKVLGPLI